MRLLNIKSAPGSHCISHGGDSDAFGSSRDTIDFNPDQIIYTRVFGTKVIINFPGRWLTISHPNWDTQATQTFYKDKFIYALENNEDIVIQ